MIFLPDFRNTLKIDKSSRPEETNNIMTEIPPVTTVIPLNITVAGVPSNFHEISLNYIDDDEL
jgi:hypothetical protein